MGAQQSQFGEVKTSVYKTENIQEGDPTKIRYGYYKNSTDVYYNGKALNLSKRENGTFKKLKYSYAKTRHFVFYEGVKIPGADPKTFTTINRKNMPDEFVSLNSVIGMDVLNNVKRIYQFGKLIFTIP
jgi:hypothetical protein